VAIEKGVKSFVLVSTDKAVRPTNIMGASKRVAELVLQALAIKNSDITFSMVRFGNVLGSSGSVVPLFRQQIANGGPITLTDSEMTRYFMTIPEASQLVIQAGAMATGGDVFVLDMGEPVKIIDLARRMVELSGMTIKDETNPDGDIEFVMTGQRPGEKLYEELLIGDNPAETTHPRIMTAHEEFFPWPELESMLEKLKSAMDANDLVEVRKLMGTMVSGYRPSADIVDLVMMRQRENDTLLDPFTETPAG
jgi:FlaA1/EpsC-like NDP-sugar epimerase